MESLRISSLVLSFPRNPKTANGGRLSAKKFVGPSCQNSIHDLSTVICRKPRRYLRRTAKWASFTVRPSKSQKTATFVSTEALFSSASISQNGSPLQQKKGSCNLLLQSINVALFLATRIRLWDGLVESCTCRRFRCGRPTHDISAKILFNHFTTAAPTLGNSVSILSKPLHQCAVR